MASFAKTGRLASHYVHEGTPIVGLARRPSDGRWRCIGCGHTYSAGDPILAVAAYRKHAAERHGNRHAAGFGNSMLDDAKKWACLRQ